MSQERKGITRVKGSQFNFQITLLLTGLLWNCCQSISTNSPSGNSTRFTLYFFSEQKTHEKFLKLSHHSQGADYTFQLVISSNQSVATQTPLLPVIGASSSIIVFSCLRMAAPSLIIFRATSSSSRPSFTKWFFRTSILGFPFSNTSFKVSRWVGGKGTAREREKHHLKYLNVQRTTMNIFLQCNKLNLIYHQDFTPIPPELHGKNSKILYIMNDWF